MEYDLTDLAHRNLSRVWTERDSARRLETIVELYQADATLNHIGAQMKGHNAINEAIGKVLASLPEDFSFFPIKPIAVNNDMARTSWGAGVDPQFPATTGMDITLFENGKIKALYVFLDDEHEQAD